MHFSNKKKKNRIHVRNFNKQHFTNWEFLNQTTTDNSSTSSDPGKVSKNKPRVSSQLFLFFLLTITLYSLTNIILMLLSDLFFYDSLDEISRLSNLQPQDTSKNNLVSFENFSNEPYGILYAKIKLLSFLGVILYVCFKHSKWSIHVIQL